MTCPYIKILLYLSQSISTSYQAHEETLKLKSTEMALCRVLNRLYYFENGNYNENFC